MSQANSIIETLLSEQQPPLSTIGAAAAEMHGLKKQARSIQPGDKGNALFWQEFEKEVEQMVARIQKAPLFHTRWIVKDLTRAFILAQTDCEGAFKAIEKIS